MANKQDLVNKIAEKGFTKKDTSAFLEALETSVGEILATGEGLMLTGFVSFEVKEVAEHEARNPKTGEKVVVPTKKKVSAKVGKTLKETANK